MMVMMMCYVSNTCVYEKMIVVSRAQTDAATQHSHVPLEDDNEEKETDYVIAAVVVLLVSVYV